MGERRKARGGEERKINSDDVLRGYGGKSEEDGSSLTRRAQMILLFSSIRKGRLARQMTGNDSYKHNPSPRACLGLFPISFFLCLLRGTEIESLGSSGSVRSASQCHIFSAGLWIGQKQFSRFNRCTQHPGV